MDSFVTLLLLTFVGSVAGLIGGVLFLIKEEWCKTLSFVATPLAAGVLLSLALLDLLPEAVEAIDTKAFTVVLVVMVAAFLFERFIFSLHHHDHGSRGSHSGPVSLVVFGDTIHNFLDGVAIAAAFMVNPSLGVVTAFAAFLHETPHEIADFGILIKNGFSKQKAFSVNFLSALATFPGAIITYFYAGKVEGATGVMVAIAAGLFLYIATTDFLPEVAHGGEKGSFKQAAFLVIGILAMVLVGTLVP